MYSYFVFNGIDSRDMGVYLAAPAPIMRGKKRVVQATVLGRAGALLLPEGDDVYEPYTQQLILRAREPVHDISKWLSGEGWVTFSGEPEYKQPAIVIDQMQFKKVSRHIAYWEATVAFLCQPFKRLVNERTQGIASGGTLVNLGDVSEKPLITLTGASGNIAVTVGEQEPLLIEGLDASYGGCVIDCDAMELLSLDGSELLTNLTTGDFPYFPVGRSTLTVTGSAPGAITVARRERWL